MKLGGIIVGIVGATLFVWHLAKVLFNVDRGTGFFTHHIISLIGGVIMLLGIWLYVVGRRKGRTGSPKAQ